MAGRKDIEAGRAFITLSLKNNVANGLKAVEKTLKAFEGIANKLGESFTRIGTVMSAPLLAAGLASEKVRSKLKEAANVLTTALEPVLLPMVDALVEIARTAATWITHNQALVSQIIKIGIGLTIAGTALKTAAATAAILAALANPLGLMVVALGAAAIAAYKLNETFRLAVTGIVDALSAGDIGRAAEIAFTAVKIYALQATVAVESAWRESVTLMATVWDAFSTGVVQAFSQAIQQVEQLWRRAVAMAQTSLSVFQAGLQALGLGGLAGGLGTIRGGLGAVGAVGGAGLAGIKAAAEGVAGAGKAALPAAANAFGPAAKEAADELERLRKKLTALSVAGKAPELAGLDFTASRGPVSTFSAAGAAALGNGLSSVPARTLEEIRAMRRGMFEAVKLLGDLAARRDRPGIFRE